MNSERQTEWIETMRGHPNAGGVVLAHKSGPPPSIIPRMATRESREEVEDSILAQGATRSVEAGTREIPEEADPFRTCFERDRDRVLHSSAFRRLAGKTQVFIFPADHQRTRLTHALEVAQVATAVSSAVGLNLALTEAIALGHDCGHGPGGHASEDAFDLFIPEGYHHAVWGADVVLRPLNLCAETLDGIRNHSWSRQTPATPEGAITSWSDRYAYCAHDLEDAISAGIVSPDDLPNSVAKVLGTTRSSQLRNLIGALVKSINSTGIIGLDPLHAEALSDLRAFNYDRIYNRPASIAQGESVVAVLRALVEYFVEHPVLLEGSEGLDEPQIIRLAVSYVAGMTDRFAFESAVTLMGWDLNRLPRGIDSQIHSAR